MISAVPSPVRDTLLGQVYGSVTTYFVHFAQSIFFLNSALSIAILTYIGNEKVENTAQESVINAAPYSLYISTVGLIVSVISLAFAYIEQRNYFVLLIKIVDDEDAKSLALSTYTWRGYATLLSLFIAVFAFIASIAMFAFFR
ncbi:MAG: hypothetical protein AAGB11_13815 [Pseudomonadota bacterium]